MGNNKPSIPKGTRDFGPEEMAKRNYIFNTIRDVYALYGFQQIETPAMETLHTLLGKYGDEGDKLLFKVLNSGDYLKGISDEELQSRDTLRLQTKLCEKGLRYDLTVPFASYVVMHRDELQLPFKRYQIQPVWRADRPQKGRYREFYQCDADVVGSDSLLNEVELMQIVDTVFTRFGVRICIKINNRKILTGIAEVIGEADKIVDITVAIDKLDKIGLEKVNEELREDGLPEEAIDKLVDAKQIIFYRESKPDGANDPDNFKDENGKYTPEGVAALVRPSIVEIYTYENALDEKSEDYIGTGSGVVLSEDGYIVTNAHVLRADGYHTVHTVDEKVYPAKIIGRDVKTDIAVIKVDGVSLQPATLGDSDETIVGEQVIAIGNPANLSSTVTDGIVSAVNRKIRSDSTGFEMDCIQTNADISPGNSGGALVNMYGQVIGITSSKYVSSSFEGLGFAISINEAVPILEELVDNGYVSGRFRIGITLIDMSSPSKMDAIEAALGYPVPEDFYGIYIDSISDDSDIKNTELKEGDFITEINGKSVRTYDEFYDTISSQYGAGDKVPATCAHVDKDGNIDYYNIEFKLLEDTSGNY